jgi:ribosomal protein L4
MKVYAKKMNKKMKQAALYAVLSQKLTDNKLFVIDEFPIATTMKTKVLLPIIKAFAPKSALVIASKAHKEIHRAVRNATKLAYAPALSLNAYEALKADTIIFEKEALEEFIKHISKETKTA